MTWRPPQPLDARYFRDLLLTVRRHDGQHAIHPYGSCRRGYLIPQDQLEVTLWRYAQWCAATMKIGLLGILGYVGILFWHILNTAKTYLPETLEGNFLGVPVISGTDWPYWVLVAGAMAFASFALRLLAAWMCFSRFTRTDGPASNRIYVSYRRALRQRRSRQSSAQGKPSSEIRTATALAAASALILVGLLWLSDGALDPRMIIFSLLPLLYGARFLLHVRSLPASLRREFWNPRQA